ncbi:phosphoribosylaminoimidazolesuccinocarboxamide synthase [Aureibacillus halotolerans]|uniref:Phosphoribosylaminoimidazole-succinocarboxamide synthase n=1 Tax=Aureibacillus halotolerans TaxID=1508390 RepID=A0A4R6TXA5_9BACI|nr:phosphoribosylaminoimidazolesuccinocarboxamide synthase [Aureibacillus halotolerans]TDQ34145.1 phosphoribosylaminoimidazole-succinocarboxamide synthase [Aureibacillus halotolerans]
MAEGQLLYEGKAKRIYETTTSGVLLVEYKDEATAFNGKKKETIAGKGVLNNDISAMIFQALSLAGVESHFVEKVSERSQKVKHVEIVPLEVVVRNVTAGSLAKRLGLNEGEPIEPAIVEFYYKDDELDDPLITEEHVRLLRIARPDELKTMKEAALKVNEELTSLFADCGIRLIDFKLEFGRTADGSILLADEVSPDTCRLWDKDTNERLDKDVFRRDLGALTTAYEEIATRLRQKLTASGGELS